MGKARIKEHFTENASFNIDKENKVLKDVAILGSVSKNGRKYTTRALEDASKIFEGAKSFIGHIDFYESSHDPRNFLGRFTNLYIKDQKVFASTFRVTNPAHWSFIEAIAENDPTAIGFSIDAVGEIKDGEVLTLTEGYSVDLVSDPATNSGLFESYSKRNNGMEWAEITLESLKTNRKDIVEAITKDFEAKIAELTEANRKLISENRVNKLLSEAKLTECPEWVKESLANTKDDALAKKIIEDLQKFTKAPISNPKEPLAEDFTKKLTSIL